MNCCIKMVTKYGMSQVLGPIAYNSESEEDFVGRDVFQSKNYSEKIAAEIDSEVKKIISDSYEKTEKILKENTDKLHKVAKSLFSASTPASVR